MINERLILLGKHILLTAPCIFKRAVTNRIFFARAIWVFLLLALAVGYAISPVYSQQTGSWSPVQTIPDYHTETEPPILVVDQDRTVHAFSSQWLGEESTSVKAIMYNQWSLNKGWTEPNDIILPSKKGQARLLGAELDQSGMMHVLFFSGDETEADIYYSQAPAVRADQAPAWTDPKIVGENALIPENGAITSDGLGNMLIVYSGRDFSHGLYAVYSNDGGSTWSDPEPLFLTLRYDLFPFYLIMFLGDSGLLHAVWSVQNINDHGQAIYYSNYSFDQGQWSQPLELARSEGGIGTQAPTIIEYDNTLYVMYYTGSNGKQIFIRSGDLGQTWTDPISPFPHVGLNGPGSFVVDANGDLHFFFWGQRITGITITHGMWHSVWQDVGWSPYKAIVSGPKILDKVGDTSFDPVTPHAAISQGNVVLVVWRTDYGSKGNGVWFSQNILDAPELPLVPLSAEDPTPKNTPLPPDKPTVMAEPALESSSLPANLSSVMPEAQGGPALPIVIAITPAILLASVIVLLNLAYRRRRL